MLRKRTLYDVFKLKILLYFVVPIILMAIIIFANHRLNIKQYYNLYTDFYNDYTDEVFLNMDKDINTIEKMDYWLKTDVVRSVFNSNEYVSDEDVEAAITQMQQMKNDFAIIDSILIVNRNGNIVISTEGKMGLDEYFNEVSVYKAYNAEYFKGMRYPENTMIKLPPTSVTKVDGETTYVMPIVKMASQNESPNSFFIFNISLEKFLDSSAMANYTDNTSFWFVNKKDKQFYSGMQSSVSIDQNIWQKINFDKKVQNYTDASGTEYYVISRTVSPNLMDYAYVVFIPMEDVNEAVSSVTLTIVLISILIYLLFAVIVLLLASNAGKVFAGLIKPFNFTEQVEMKEVFRVTDKITKEFSTIVNENNSMKQELKDMEGDVKEKMITDVLNNKNRQVRMSLYKYDGFLPIIFCIVPKKSMSEKVLFSLREELYFTIRNYLGQNYETYDIINMDENVHFVLNVPHDLEIDSLKNELKKLADIVVNQEINVKFEYRIGEICDDFEKLKFEYMQMRDELNGKSDAYDLPDENNYIYRASEHNSIINSVLEGDYNKTMANIDRILIANAVNGVSGNNARLLYQNIVNTIVTALKMKKLDVDSIIEKIGNDIYFNIDKLSESELSLFILELLKSVGVDDNVNSEDKIMSDIMEYVDNNYCDYTITLESVAKQFGVDAKNLSKQFKKHNQVTFHKYLTELKIGEAKRLLMTTNMSVEQIYTQVGYISRTTFIRAFTSIEKVTPSEYRKNKGDKL